MSAAGHDWHALLLPLVECYLTTSEEAEQRNTRLQTRSNEKNIYSKEKQVPQTTISTKILAQLGC